MFMTAGSCSVMLLWPTRRIFSCHGKVAGSTGARRVGRGMSFGAGPLVATSATVSEETAEDFRAWMAAATGSEAAPVLRKVRRFSMPPLLPMLPCTRSGKVVCHISPQFCSYAVWLFARVGTSHRCAPEILVCARKMLDGPHFVSGAMESPLSPKCAKDGAHRRADLQ